MSLVGIVDYQIVNIGSILKAVSRFTSAIDVVTTPDQLPKVDKLILPGVGAFGKAAYQLRHMELWDGIIDFINRKKRPFLGICLGMQLLLSSSEEAPDVKGLDVVHLDIIRFEKPGLRCPHIGWNTISYQISDPLFNGLENPFYSYFCHSYHLPMSTLTGDIELGITEYGAAFVSAFRRDNVWAVQFHPEKSQRNGLKIIENFVSLCG